MKILIISSHFPNMIGGVSDYTYFLSKYLSNDHCKIYILTSEYNDIKKDEDTYINVNPTISKWNILGIRKIISEIKSINPDVILLQYVPYMYSKNGIPIFLAFIIFYLNIKGTKVITTFHEVAREIELSKIRYFFIAIFQRLIAYWICMNSFRIVVTLKVYQNMLRPFKNKIEIIPVGSNFKNTSTTETELKKLRISITPNNHYLISTFSTNIDRLSLILKILSLLQDEAFPIKLLIIGSINKEKLAHQLKESKLNDSVILTGYLESDNVFKHLKISDLFVFMGSFNERGYTGASTKYTSLVAAYSAGLPVFAIKGYMTDDFFSHMNNIYFVENENASCISNEIKNLLTDQDTLRILKRGSIETYEKKLSWPVIANRYLEIIK